MPVKVHNKETQTWLVNTVKDFATADTESFRAWYPGETPKNFIMEIYLQSDHDGLGAADVLTILKKLNKLPPLPQDFKITSVDDSTDKAGVTRGRVVKIAAGAKFYQFCKERNFELLFAGGKVPCITKEDKQRSLHANKKRPINTDTQKTSGKKPSEKRDGEKRDGEKRDGDKAAKKAKNSRT
jgi:hypothetical protein